MSKQTLTVQLMHANTRIAELTQNAEHDTATINMLHRDIESLHADMEYLRSVYEDTKRQLDVARPAAPAPSNKGYVRKPLPAHFIAARGAAMRMGKAVRVQA